jgi:hypothetical protein
MRKQAAVAVVPAVVPAAVRVVAVARAALAAGLQV